MDVLQHKTAEKGIMWFDPINQHSTHPTQKPLTSDKIQTHSIILILTYQEVSESPAEGVKADVSEIGPHVQTLVWK